ncbi:unnamed protein product [Prorocentrum cordatum]|uniref:Feruloyl esterase n=1 Tax=Prorocentrum cordatum TaxID=2364126 RepID=A0ABN9XY50_9DINO|nr:unnamed protein product [Polarella glacialis]
MALGPAWFACPSCDRMVTGLVLGAGPENMQSMCRTHCCFQCRDSSGARHDDYWCAGTPGSGLRQVEIPRSGGGGPLLAHCVVHEPSWEAVRAPVPALLYLHGISGAYWPEALYWELYSVVSCNEAAGRFLIVAPLAAPGEPLAVESGRRRHRDRFGNQAPYVEEFHCERTWRAFVSVCRELGPGLVDFSRLCVTGYSMGGYSAWKLAFRYGSLLSAVAPMASYMFWPEDADERGAADHCAELGSLPICWAADEQDTANYSVSHLRWLAGTRSLCPEPSVAEAPVGRPGDPRAGVQAVYCNEDVFAFFGWLERCRNRAGEHLLIADSERDGSDVELGWKVDADPGSVMPLDLHHGGGARVIHCSPSQLVLQVPEHQARDAHEWQHVTASPHVHGCRHLADRDMYHRVVKVDDVQPIADHPDRHHTVRLTTKELKSANEVFPNCEVFFSFNPVGSQAPRPTPPAAAPPAPARRLGGLGGTAGMRYNKPKVSSSSSFQPAEHHVESILNLQLPHQMSKIAYNWDYDMNTTKNPQFRYIFPGGVGLMRLYQPYLIANIGLRVNFSSQMKDIRKPPHVFIRSEINGTANLNADIATMLNFTKQKHAAPPTARTIAIEGAAGMVDAGSGTAGHQVAAAKFVSLPGARLSDCFWASIERLGSMERPLHYWTDSENACAG